MSITKVKPGRTARLQTLEMGGGVSSAASYQCSEERITYAAGPKYSYNGTLNWKTCTHQKGAQVSGRIATTSAIRQSNGDVFTFGCDIGNPTFASKPSSASAQQARQQAWDSYWQSLDLNCRNRVLAYSAVAQMVPMLGAALKVSSTLNRIGKWARRLRDKPFIEVVKSAISADFIDRFVVKPTIADMNMLRDAHCYVVRVLETAHTRNAMPYQFTGKGFSGGSMQTSEQTAASYRWSSTYQTRVSCRGTCFGGVESTLHVLSKVYYDVHTVKPLKLWLARTGLSTPLDAAWDLIPFSFVADYFLRIGDLIERVSTDATSQDGLRGQVSKIYGSWFTEKVGQWTTYKPVGEITYYRPSAMNSFFRSLNTTYGTQTFTKGFTFSRFPAPLLGESRFWDNPLLNANGLSSTQKRTLAELAIQLVL